MIASAGGCRSTKGASHGGDHRGTGRRRTDRGPRSQDHARRAGAWRRHRGRRAGSAGARDRSRRRGDRAAEDRRRNRGHRLGAGGGTGREERRRHRRHPRRHVERARPPAPEPAHGPSLPGRRRALHLGRSAQPTDDDAGPAIAHPRRVGPAMDASVAGELGCADRCVARTLHHRRRGAPSGRGVRSRRERRLPRRDPERSRAAAGLQERLADAWPDERAGPRDYPGRFGGRGWRRRGEDDRWRDAGKRGGGDADGVSGGRGRGERRVRG